VNKEIGGDSSVVEQLAFQLKDGGSIPTSPLQFEIKELRVQTACELNKRWHSRLPEIDWSNVTRNRYYVCYGALFEQKWFAVAIWSSPVNQNFNLDETLELRRMAICPEAPKNTASRMLAVMARLIKKRFPKVNRLISYQDTAVHQGTIYKASGWEPASRTKYQPWDRSRQRAKSQSDADKIRWELLFGVCEDRGNERKST
jgi:hypothetical protein